MFHPLLGNLGGLTDVQLEQKLSELTRKWMNLPLVADPNVRRQLSLLLDAHREEVLNRTYAKQDEALKKGGVDPFASLDIS